MTNVECGLFDLSDRVALVTGGSRGLGLAMAHALGAAGARVAITARRTAELEEARAELEREGIETFAVQNDAAEITTAVPLVRRVLGHFGTLDILVCNAGATWGAPAESHPMDAWEKVLAVNLNGTWALCQAAAIEAMIPRRQGSIVIVASCNGLGGNQPGGVPTVAYNTSKAGQINLARCLAGEWGRYGIRANALLPGWFPTKMTHGTLTEHGDDFEGRIPLRRLGEARADLAGPILLLASDAGRYVTGHALVVDGGMTALV